MKSTERKYTLVNFLCVSLFFLTYGNLFLRQTSYFNSNSRYSYLDKSIKKHIFKYFQKNKKAIPITVDNYEMICI